MVNGSAHAKFSSSDVDHVLQEEDNQIQTEEKHHAINMRYVQQHTLILPFCHACQLA